MTAEQEYTDLPIPPNEESTGGQEKEPFGPLDIGLTQKQMTEWYYHSNLVTIPEMLKKRTSSPRTFAATVSAFRAVWTGMLGTMKSFARGSHQKERRWPL